MALVSDQSRTNTIINNTGFIRSGLGNWYQINQEPIQSLTGPTNIGKKSKPDVSDQSRTNTIIN